MQTYPVDIDPGQVARWLKAECEVAPSTFKISARRRQEAREIPVRAETHLGDEEREDLTEIATIATLEIAPVHAGDGWLLSTAHRVATLLIALDKLGAKEMPKSPPSQQR
jgi:hypothetical protein